jgi:hypothetical protein
MRNRHRNRLGTPLANMRFVFGLGSQRLTAPAIGSEINDLRMSQKILSTTLSANASECGTVRPRSPALRRRAAAWFNRVAGSD